MSDSGVTQVVTLANNKYPTNHVSLLMKLKSVLGIGQHYGNCQSAVSLH